MAKVIGLTGGIASGKTIISDYLVSQGFHVIDADLIAREVVAPGSPGLSAVREKFGDHLVLPDGRLNRKMLGETVFSDANALASLNQLLHPFIQVCIQEALDALPESGLAFLVVPLLYETNDQALCDEVWLVMAPMDARLQRLMQRDKLTREEAEARIATQMTDEEKLKHRPVVFCNNGSVADLIRQVEEKLEERKGL